MIPTSRNANCKHKALRLTATSPVHRSAPYFHDVHSDNDFAIEPDEEIDDSFATHPQQPEQDDDAQSNINVNDDLNGSGYNDDAHSLLHLASQIPTTTESSTLTLILIAA